MLLSIVQSRPSPLLCLFVEFLEDRVTARKRKNLRPRGRSEALAVAIEDVGEPFRAERSNGSNGGSVGGVHFPSRAPNPGIVSLLLVGLLRRLRLLSLE